MAFWKVLFPNNEPRQENSTLEQKLNSQFPEMDHEQLAITASIAGLLGRVAYVDMNIHESEVTFMKKALKEECELNDQQVETIAKITVEDINELAGIENHFYTAVLKEALSESERFNILKCLFAMAASDDNASNEESEEIRTIAHGLALGHKHFVSAKSTVKEKLGALKK